MRALHPGILLLCATLAACGGGGGSGNPPVAPPQQATPQPTSADVAMADAAALKAVVNPSANTVRLQWNDSVSNASQYEVERQMNGAWTTVDTQTTPVANNTREWNGSLNAATALRVQARLTGYSVPITVPLATVSKAHQIEVATPGTPAIVISMPEPLTDSATVSLSGVPNLASVEYLLGPNGGSLVGSSNSGPDYATQIGFNMLTPGTTVIRARGLNADATFELERTVTIGNHVVGVSVEMLGLKLGTNVAIAINTKSDFGIREVEGFLDGVSLGVLTTPNAGVPPYAFVFDARAAGSGPHAIKVRVTANNGVVGQYYRVHTIDNPPLVAISSPGDGALVNGNLHLAGSTSTDKQEPVRLVATLGSQTILDTQNPTFATDFSLAGITPGPYTLKLVAQDSTNSTTVERQVVVTSSGELVLEPLVTMGPNASLLAVDGVGTFSAVYRTGNVPVHLPGNEYRLLTDTTSTVLDLSGLYYERTGDWHLDNGRALALCVPSGDSTSVHVCRWSSDGQMTDLATLGPGGSDIDIPESAINGVRWPWVLASHQRLSSNGSTSYGYALINTETRARIVPPLTRPVFGDRLSSGINNFHGSPGAFVLYFPSLDDSLHNSVVRRWQQANGQEDIVSSTGYEAPQTDGVRAAWTTRFTDSVIKWRLEALNIAGGARTEVARQLPEHETWYLANGLLAWRQVINFTGSPLPPGVFVSGPTGNVTTLSSRQSSLLYGVGATRVLYTDDGRLYVADHAGNARMLLDSVPKQAMISGETVVFTLGEQNTLYRVRLN